MARTPFKTRNLEGVVELRLDVRIANWLGAFGVQGDTPVASELLVRERIPIEVSGETRIDENEVKQLELALRLNLDPLRDLLSRIEVAVTDAIEAERARVGEETP